MRRYPREISDFIVENYVGITTAELVDRLNAAFGTAYTADQIGAYKKNHKLHSGVKAGRVPHYSDLFPKEVSDFIHANATGIGPTPMTDLLNEHFKAEYTPAQVKGFYNNHKVVSGVTGRFEKGRVPKNKGKKGIYHAGSEKGWFKKGHTPQTHKPVGSESLRSDGYWWVKIAEPNKWKEKHVLVWEAVHGERPAGHNIIFLDGDRGNFAIDNLLLVTKSEHAVMAHLGCRSGNADLTRTRLLLAKVKIAASRRKKAKERKRK